MPRIEPTILPPVEGRPEPHLTPDETAKRYAALLATQEREHGVAESRNWQLGELVAKTEGIEDNPKGVYVKVIAATTLTSDESVRLNHRTFEVFPTAESRVSRRSWNLHQIIRAPVTRLLEAEGIEKPTPAQIGSKAREFLNDPKLGTEKKLRQAVNGLVTKQGGGTGGGKRRLATVEKILVTLANEIKDGKVQKRELAVDIWERELRRIRPMPLREFSAVADAARKLPSLIDATTGSAQLAQFLGDFIRTQVSTAKVETRDMAVSVIRRVVEGELERVLSEITKTSTKPGKTDPAA